MVIVLVASDVPLTVADPSLYPVRDVFCVMVADVAGASPVTVKSRVLPEVEVIATDPAETVGVDQVKAAS